MSYNAAQFRDLIRRVLMEQALHSPEAEELLMGTAAVESDLGTYLRQVRGPALGVFQMEPETFRWLKQLYSSRLERREPEEMEWDLRLSILAARLRYVIVPERLPDASDVPGLAAYWKRHYNTMAGSGTVEHYVRAYSRYVTPPGR